MPLRSNNLIGFGARRSGAFRTPEYGYRTTVTDVSTVSGGVNRTFSGVDIGSADPDREVIVVFSARTSVLVSSVTSFTIGGVSATQVVPIVGVAGAQITMYRANVPSGTTANIVVTLPQTSTDGTIHVYRVVPRTSSTPVDAGSGSATTTTVTASDIAVTTGGFLIVGVIDGLNPAALTPVYNGVDTPTNNYGAVVNSRTRLTWSAATTETVGTNDPGASKPSSSGFNMNVVAASWD